MTLTLNQPLATTLGAARRVLPKLKRLGIVTLRDLLYHIPSRYEDFSSVVPIRMLKQDQPATIQGKILSIANSRTWKKRMVLTEAVVQDESDAVKVVWFNQPFIAQRLSPGTAVSLSGKVTYGHDSLYLSNPAYEIIRKPTTALHTARLVPVYPETAGLTSRWLRFLIGQALKKVGAIADPMPSAVLNRQKLPPLADALFAIHFPKTLPDAAAAKRRLAFDEIFLIQLANLRERLRLAKEKAPVIPLDIKGTKAFIERLPFVLTTAQKRAAWEILQDLAKPIPMNRLLEGDVGSGKTVIAALAGWVCIRNGYQAAVMAPTEILARQHFATLKKIVPEISPGLCVSSQRRIGESVLTRKTFVEKVRRGDINLIIGTHALIQKDLTFPKLALVVIDEQHRFGVEQRARLIKNHESGIMNQGDDEKPIIQNSKFMIPHFLSMTATPIPRTLALTLYGNLDISILDELPKGRQSIITEVVPPARRQETYEFVRQEVRRGRQTFVICPRIEIPNSKFQIPNKFQAPSSKLQARNAGWDEAKAVLAEYEKLSKEIFPDLRIAMLHGKMKPKEKEAVMEKFLNREYDIVVSTSVVEVGVDVPNASIMLIEGAEHFGLAQLHQFRGRVGRGEHQSYCFLFTDSPARTTNQRMRAILAAGSGFELAEQDLRIRGPGDFTGFRQAGLADLAMTALDDIEFIRQIRQEAQRFLTADPQLERHPSLAQTLAEFRARTHFE